MIKAHEALASAALALPPAARVELAERLLDSVEDRGAAVDAAWAAEAERRIDQLDRDEATLVPGDALMEKLLPH